MCECRHASAVEAVSDAKKPADVLDENAEELAQLESRNVGKPLMASRDEMPFSADNLRFFAGAARNLEGKSAAPERVKLNVAWEVSSVPAILDLVRGGPGYAALTQTAIRSDSNRDPLTVNSRPWETSRGGVTLR